MIGDEVCKCKVHFDLSKVILYLKVCLMAQWAKWSTFTARGLSGP